MPISSATAHRVLAACLIAVGVLLLCGCALGVLLVLGFAPMRGAGNPDVESLEAGHREDVRSLWVAGSIGVVGVFFLVGGMLRWPRRR
jgi:hypothetical protein